MKAYTVLFAGAVGSGKTTMATYLSKNLNLVVLNNDAIRAEITAALGKFDEVAFEKLRQRKFDYLLDKKLSFIYDASIDRRWQEFKNQLNDSNYDYFVISLNFSKPLVEKLLTRRDSDLSTNDKYLSDHANFLDEFGSEVNLNLSDKDFDNQLQASLEAVEKWLKGLA